MIMPPTANSKPGGGPLAGQFRPQFQLDRSVQGTLQRALLAGRFHASRVIVEGRATPGGPAGPVHRHATFRLAYEADQAGLAAFLATADARSDRSTALVR